MCAGTESEADLLRNWRRGRSEARHGLTRVYTCICTYLHTYLVCDDDCIPPRDTSPHQDSTGTAPSGTPLPAQPPPPPQTRETQSHSAPTPLKRPMLYCVFRHGLGGRLATKLAPIYIYIYFFFSLIYVCMYVYVYTYIYIFCVYCLFRDGVGGGPAAKLAPRAINIYSYIYVCMCIYIHI